MKDYRCKKCHKLLCKLLPGNGNSNVNVYHLTKVEIKCSKCKEVNIFKLPSYLVDDAKYFLVDPKVVEHHKHQSPALVG